MSKLIGGPNVFFAGEATQAAKPVGYISPTAFELLQEANGSAAIVASPAFDTTIPLYAQARCGALLTAADDIRANSFTKSAPVFKAPQNTAESLPNSDAARAGAEPITRTALPELPDDDLDFTPDLARKIIAKYQEIYENAVQAACDLQVWCDCLNDALEKIALLDEADGHELTREHALRAVAIATSTLGKHPSQIFAERAEQ